MKRHSSLSAIKSFLNLLNPPASKNFNDGLKLSGHLDITVKKRGKIIDEFSLKNIILDNGKQKTIEALAAGSSNHQIFRMAIGSEGAMTSDKFQPKIPNATMVALYHEVYRTDVYDPPTTGTKLATFIADFNSVNVPDAAFINASERYINEAALIMGDGTYGGGDKTGLETPDADESLFSIRTFKSIPFDAGDDITITIRWTVYVQ